MFYHSTNSLPYYLLLAAFLVGSAVADSAKDKQECTEQLAGLATCLPYVGGQAKAPTPDCCTGLKQVLKNNKKCLCVIIKDRNDPDLGGLQINVTLALSLPTVCNAAANVSKCPELLHMDPKSPEAQVFYQLNKGAMSPAPSPSVGGSPEGGKREGTSTSSEASSSTQKNDAFRKEGRFFVFDILAVGLLVWTLLGSATRNFFTWSLI